MYMKKMFFKNQIPSYYFSNENYLCSCAIRDIKEHK